MPTAGETSRNIPSRSVVEAWPHAPALAEDQATVPEGLASSTRLHGPSFVRDDVISIALIDEHSFTRESISRSLHKICNILNVVPFATATECLHNGGSFDVILYHTHEKSEKENGAERLSCIKQVLPVAPVVILGDVDSFDSIRAAFDSGARGYIPTESTSLEIAIEIMYLVKAGGTFVPPSSLSPQRSKSPPSREPGAVCRFTRRQTDVLDRLKLGQSNKAIAFGLKMSESSVKTHIQNIMRKLGATNRTEVACLVQRLEMSGMHPAG